MMTDQTLISGAPRVKLKWYQVIDPITKLLFILDMTLLSFASMNLLLQAGLILVATLLLLFSKLSSTIFKALGFSLFLICTMLIIQGLFYSRNQTVLFSVLGGVVLQRRPDLRHHSGLSSIGDYFDQWLFYGDHEYFRKRGLFGTVRIVL